MMLHLRPNLVQTDCKHARPLADGSMEGLVRIAQSPDWLEAQQSEIIVQRALPAFGCRQEIFTRISFPPDRQRVLAVLLLYNQYKSSHLMEDCT